MSKTAKNKHILIKNGGILMDYNDKTTTNFYSSINPIYTHSGTITSADTFYKRMKIKDVLKKWFNDDIGEGFSFKYANVEFILIDNQIRSSEKFHRGDYGYGEYEDLFEWIDTKNLDEEVEITNYVYKTTTQVYDKNNIYKLNRDVRCCPVCGGNGIVENGFYNHTGRIWITSTTTPEQCRSCNGKGYIEI